MTEWNAETRARLEAYERLYVGGKQPADDIRAALAEIDRLEGLLKLADRIAEKSREIKLTTDAQP